ncbi:FAD/NAD(P)-binding protein [Geobacter sp. AOG2]|uniref:FAD/NAD(P)-binding protein n=1 Tax=Geobacter sp. AOG2 TaxID=1566347 RepID=UPI001CC67887|nr:FAD/NAD(P)-binding protein [Geobacter sp. AOG2]GFE61836.1 oxidoreductase [Geobacter sp. AOG2]
MRNDRDPTIAPLPATIIGLKTLSADTALFRLTLENSEGDRFDFNPGQFIQLSVPSGGEVPISLAGPPRLHNSFEVCVRRVGHVTDMLHRLLPGDRLGVRGPFGNGFPLGEWTGRNILLIAGGLGIAPLRSLLYALLMQREGFGEITLMYGAREPSAILFKEELAELSGRRDMHLFLTVDFAQEESPSGLACNTGLLPTLLRGVNFGTTNTVAAVCGPPALYRCILEELQELGIPAEHIYLSLERRMKCGVGLCCHCAVGDLFCCSDGPVFSYSQLKGISGAI